MTTSVAALATATELLVDRYLPHVGRAPGAVAEAARRTAGRPTDPGS